MIGWIDIQPIVANLCRVLFLYDKLYFAELLPYYFGYQNILEMGSPNNPEGWGSPTAPFICIYTVVVNIIGAPKMQNNFCAL